MMQHLWHTSVVLPMMPRTKAATAKTQTAPRVATRRSSSQAERVMAVAWGSNKTQITPAKTSARMYRKHEAEAMEQERHVWKRTKFCPGMPLRRVANKSLTNPTENEKNSGGSKTCCECGTPTHWYCVLCHNWYCVDISDKVRLKLNNDITGKNKVEVKRKVKERPGQLVSIQYSDSSTIVGKVVCWNIGHRIGYDESPNWEL